MVIFLQDKGSTVKTNQDPEAQINRLEAGQSAMGLKANPSADDKAFEANDGNVGAQGSASDRTIDGANGRITRGIASGTIGKGNRGLDGDDDKSLEAGAVDTRANNNNDGGQANRSSPTSGSYAADDDHDDDEKGVVAHHISHSVTLDHASTSRRRREAPPLVRDLGHEERARLERALVRKIDLRLLPMIILMYILNYLDRNNIASARLAGLETDLGLVGTQYQTCVSILFVGYLLMQGMLVFLLPLTWGCGLEHELMTA